MKRTKILVLASIVLPATTVCGQGRSVEQYKRDLDKAVAKAELYYGVRRSRYEKELEKDRSQLEKDVQQLVTAADELKPRISTFNEIISEWNKDPQVTSVAIDASIDRLRKKYSATSGSRIGIHNPYTGESYVRWYDDLKNDIFDPSGYLVVSKAVGSYRMLERQRSDWAKAYRRARETLDARNREHDALAKYAGAITAAQGRIAVWKSEAERRLQQFTGSKTTPSPTRPVASSYGKASRPKQTGTAGTPPFYIRVYNSYTRRPSSPKGSYTSKEAALRKLRGYWNMALPPGSRGWIYDSNDRVIQTLSIGR